MKKITSVQNHFIKSLILLREKPRARRENSQFLIEGEREINLAFNGGYAIEIILFYPKIYPLEKAQELSGKSEIIEINKEVFFEGKFIKNKEHRIKKIAYIDYAQPGLNTIEIKWNGDKADN